MGVGMVHNFDGDDRAGLTVMVPACLQIVSRSCGCFLGCH